MYLSYAGLFQKIRLYYFKSVFMKYASQPGVKVLDYGCGPGDALLICRESGIEAVGVDAYDYSIDMAKKRGLMVHKADYTSLPFAKGSFDVIFLQSVLEHLKDPVDAVIHLKSYLKPNGVMILSAPTPGSHFWDDPTHVRPFTPKSFKQLADLLDMHLEHCNYIFFQLLGLTITNSIFYKLMNTMPFSMGSNIIGIFRMK